MFFDLNKKNGFTLIELIVVFTIVVLLAAVSIGGYSKYRRSSLFGLSVDSFVLRLDELKNSSTSGGDSVCSGLSFEGENPFIYEQKFNNKKVWKGEIEGFAYGGCDGEIYDRQDVVLGKAVFFKEIALIDDTKIPKVVDSFEMRFLPPSGIIEISLNGGSFQKPQYNELNFTVSDGEKDLKIRYDLNSLNILKGNEK